MATGVHTEFYVQQTGSNLNAGSTTSDTAVFTSTGGDSDGTSVFTPNDGSTPASTISAGMFGAVYVTAGATVATFIGRITAVAAGVNGAVTFSTTAKSGTFPAASAGAHTITMKVGGAWKGPNGSDVFPFGTIAAATMNASNNTPRVNFKAGTDYAITANMLSNLQGPITFEGYTTTPGDGGRAWFDGGATGTSFVLLNNTQNYNRFINLGFKNNGNSGTARDCFTNTGNSVLLYGLIVHDVYRTGIQTAGNTSAKYCEVYNCNQSNTVNQGGMSFASAGSSLERCVSHSNRNGTNGNGFILDTSLNFIMCLSVNNQGHGVISNGDTNQNFYFSDFCFNGGEGFRFNGGSQVMQSSFTGCNFIGNGGYGILYRTIGHQGMLLNCGFGSGTMANGSGNISASEPWAITEIGTVTYTANTTPYRDYVNGDFSITSSQSKGQGPGAFNMTKSGYGGTVGYSDIGAAASQPASGGGGGYGFSG